MGNTKKDEKPRKQEETIPMELEPPYGLEVYDITGKSVTLKWKCAIYEVLPDGFRIYYKVLSEEAGSPDLTHIDVRYEKSAQDHTYKVTDLSPGTKYEFCVVACNKAQESDPSDKMQAITLACPKKPTGLKIESISHEQAILTWVESTETGRPVKYKVGFAPSADPEHVTYTGVQKAKCTVNGLRPGIEYNFFVMAYNDVGESKSSNAVQKRTIGLPAKPVNLKIIEVTHDCVTLQWTKGPGSDPPIRYKVGYTPVTKSENVRYIHVDQQYCTVDSLTPGSDYTFFVIACNQAGESERSDEMRAQTKGPPSQPSKLKVDEIFHNSVTLKWTMDVTRDLPVSYKVGYTPVASESIRYIEAEQPTCTVDCLMPKTEFKFFVIACNKVGESKRSAVEKATTKEIPAQLTESWIKNQGLTLLIVLVAFLAQSYYYGISSGKVNQPKELNEIKLGLQDLTLSFSTLKQKQINDQETHKNIIEERIKDLKKMDEKTLKDLTEKVETTTSEFISANEKIEELEKTKKALESKTNDLKRNFDSQIKEMETSFKEKIDNLTNFVSAFEETFSGYKSSFDSFDKETSGKMALMKKEFKDLSENVKVMVKDVSEQFEPQVKKLKQAKQEVDRILQDLTSDMDTIKPNTFNKESLTIAFCIVIVIQFVLALWIYYVQHRGSTESVHGNKDMNARDVLEKIPRGVALSKSVCIISFDEARQKAHEALVQSALTYKFETTYFVVRRHEHLMKLPRCKFFIMCTEFSERHVIIEEPGLGLGDLKRCTYEAIQRYRASMVILYTRDPGSRNLRDQHYNNNIYCVSKQPELVDLRNKCHFFSTYDELSDFQKMALKDAVTRCLQ